MKFGERLFGVGKGGKWRVRCGETCLIGNGNQDGDELEGNGDAVAHVFSVE